MKMACSACSKRNQGRIVPVNAAKKPAERQSNSNGAKAQGHILRERLRYSGR